MVNPSCNFALLSMLRFSNFRFFLQLLQGIDRFLNGFAGVFMLKRLQSRQARLRLSLSFGKCIVLSRDCADEGFTLSQYLLRGSLVEDSIFLWSKHVAITRGCLYVQACYCQCHWKRQR
ncbi:hypothetical protein D3C84_851630 [compost metagenome]